VLEAAIPWGPPFAAGVLPDLVAAITAESGCRTG
jgi:hypothetical protein